MVSPITSNIYSRVCSSQLYGGKVNNFIFKNSILKSHLGSLSQFSSIVSNFATVDPTTLSGSNVHTIQNLVQGKWESSKKYFDVIDPMNGEVFIKSPHTQNAELQEFVDSMKMVPKSGTHNIFKNPERFLMYGKVFQKAAELLHKKEVHSFFVKCIQRTMPKSTIQAAGEVNILRNFCENFSGDSVRFLMRGFSVAGDYQGQQSNGYRWPYGPVMVISPFNFPLEIPVMQFLSAAMVGNKPTVKTEATQGLPVEQFLRFLHYCGLPLSDIDFINTRGPEMSQLIQESPVRLVQFTGGIETANKLLQLTNGKVKIEDAGFDWKILGADLSDIDYVAWQCDQDAYSISGQKCSAQSMLMAHTNWIQAGLVDKLQKLASKRSLNDLTCCPILSHTNEDIQNHIKELLSIPGAKLLFGGKPLVNHTIPLVYGSFEPTAIFVPLDSMISCPQALKISTKEIFGPLQIITEWKSAEEDHVVEILEKMDHHLTAAIVSKDMQFLHRMLSKSVNGTTYAGIKARTTGAPQNHWFGPAGDPRAAGIGSPEAILQTWTCHREVIYDIGPISNEWSTPPPS